MLKTHHSKRERAQTMVIFALGLIVFIAFLALALDGGYTWFQRRKAQTAADAGALAGARQYCLAVANNQANPQLAARTEAINYVGLNDAAILDANSDITIDTDLARVTVTSHVVFKTFFAHIIGFPEIDAQATAQAGCFAPGVGTGVLPVAWSCRPSIEDTGGEIEPTECEETRIPLTTFEDEYFPNYLTTAYPEIYMVMDSGGLECKEDGGTIICDLDGDGDKDVLLASDETGGNFSWLDLDGNETPPCDPSNAEGSTELVEWIDNGFPCDLGPHTWVPGQTGVQTNVFQAASRREGEIVAVPVFDDWCDGKPDILCPGKVHVGDVIKPVNATTSPFFFHIDTFAAFGISCVQGGETHKQDDCPGWTLFREKNAEIGVSIHPNLKSIEGYFINGFLPGFKAGDPGVPDAGAYVLLLTQ